MPNNNPKNADEALLLAFACGATVENAARKAGVSERTAYRRLSEPAFRQRLRALRTELVERSMGMLTAATLEAVKTLVSLQDAAQPAAVRLGAARAIIDYGLKLRDEHDLTGRIALLEEQVGAAA